MKNPVKFNVRKELWSLSLLIIAAAISFWSFPQLPERVASHWSFSGQVDGWSSRSFHSWFFPGLLVGIYLMFLALPAIDPKKERYADFLEAYYIFKNCIITVLFTIYVSATAYNLGYGVNIGAITGGTIGVMMMVIGNYFGKLKRNWFIGIRNPWTLSSEDVWNKTHRLGGKLFVIWGLMLFVAPWTPAYIGLSIVIGGAVLAVVWTAVYSYMLYKKEKLHNAKH
jgi:uncharacterized membrane protein